MPWLASIVNWAPIHEHILSDADYQASQAATMKWRKNASTLLLFEQNPTVIFLHFDATPTPPVTASGFDPANPDYLQAIEADRPPALARCWRP